MKFTILFSDRSSKTGRDLLNKFKPLSTKALRKRTDRKLNTDVVLRWGSTETFSRLRSRLELNSLESVTNASNKRRMMEILVEAGIPTPKIVFSPFDYPDHELDEYRDESNNFYVRGANQEVRYTGVLQRGDLYASKPVVNKRREYRVHVFNEEVIAIYEKIPNEGNTKLFKAHNCHFELKNKENCKLTVENQQVCIDAVKSLGLLFGGVDVMRDKDQNIFISEVNSAPALNGTNIDRYVTKITEYIKQQGVA
jgi:glutathione synthase/RimK-type ligase-like ATP-grasp enzyme